MLRGFRGSVAEKLFGFGNYLFCARGNPLTTMEKSKLNNNNMDVDEGDSDEGLEADFSLDDLNPQHLPIDFEDDDDEEEDYEGQLAIGSPYVVIDIYFNYHFKLRKFCGGSWNDFCVVLGILYITFIIENYLNIF
jgi:hypothetical protein